jgi:hypothetical protein
VATRKTPLRVRTRGQKRTAPGHSSALLELIRSEVKRFVLHDAPIATFQKAVRDASRAGKFSSHPLSGTEFRRIVKEAVIQRRQIMSQRRFKRETIKRKGPSK